MKHLITTIPAYFFDQWKPKPVDGHDERVLRYLSMHDGESLRHFMKHYNFKEDQPTYEAKPWFWLLTTPMGPPKEMVVGESVCFYVYKGQVIGYFDIVGVGIKREFAWFPDEDDFDYQRLGDKCLALANWHPGHYGPLTGFQGWRYTPLRP